MNLLSGLGSVVALVVDQPILQRLLVASLEAAALGLMVAALIRLARLRSPRVICLLWMIVLLKPVVSLAVGSMIPILRLEAAAASTPEPAAIAGQIAQDQPAGIVPSTGPLGGIVGAEADPTATGIVQQAAEPAMTPEPESTAQSVLEAMTTASMLIYAWLAGMVIALLYHLRCRLRMHRIIRGAQAASEPVARRYAALGGEIGLKRRPRLLVTHVLESPAIVGTLHPTVLLPAWLTADGESRRLDWSIRHELTHYRWLDPWGVFLRDVALVVFWFHPVVWWSGRRLVEAMELACDRAMLQRPADAADYAEQLFCMLQNLRQRRRIAIGGLFATRTQVGRRIASLLETPFKKTPQLTLLSGVGLILVAAAALAIGGTVGKPKVDGVDAPSMPVPAAATQATAGADTPATTRPQPGDGTTMRVYDVNDILAKRGQTEQALTELVRYIRLQVPFEPWDKGSQINPWRNPDDTQSPTKPGSALVIKASPLGHHKIRELLVGLREAGKNEILLNMAFVRLSEADVERAKQILTTDRTPPPANVVSADATIGGTLADRSQVEQILQMAGSTSIRVEYDTSAASAILSLAPMCLASGQEARIEASTVDPLGDLVQTTGADGKPILGPDKLETIKPGASVWARATIVPEDHWAHGLEGDGIHLTIEPTLMQVLYIAQTPARGDSVWGKQVQIDQPVTRVSSVITEATTSAGKTLVITWPTTPADPRKPDGPKVGFAFLVTPTLAKSLPWPGATPAASEVAGGIDVPQTSPSSPGTTPSGRETGTLKWKFQTKDLVYSSPAIGPDGTIYVGSCDHNLYALRPDGTEKWRFATAGRVYCAAAVGLDGTVHILPTGDKLYAIGPDGNRKWDLATNLTAWSAPTIGRDGTLYLGADALVALEPGGQVKWTFEPAAEGPQAESEKQEHVAYAPAIGPDGTLHFVSQHIASSRGGGRGTQGSKTLYAVNPDGALKWTFQAPERLLYQVAVDGGGTVYAMSLQTLYAVDHKGALRWRKVLPDLLQGPPVVARDGTVYVQNRTDAILAINPDGTEKWTGTLKDRVYGALSLAEDGTIYAGVMGGLLAVGPDGKVKWSFQTTDRNKEVACSPAIGGDGTIYFGSADGHVYALWGSAGPARAGWATLGGDMQRSGRAGPAIQRPGRTTLGPDSSPSSRAAIQGSRILHFPKDRSLGALQVMDTTVRRQIEDFYYWIDGTRWDYLSEARGDVVVPPGKRVQLAVSETGCKDLSPLDRLAPDDLDELAVAYLPASDSCMPHIGHLAGLRVLNLRDSNITDAGLCHLRDMTSLERLYLPKGLTDAGMVHVGQLRSLKGLYFGHNRVSNKGLAQLENLTNLEELELGGAYVNQAGKRVPSLMTGPGLAHLAKLPRLRYLELEGDFGDEGLEHLKDCHGLRTLNVMHLDITDAGLARISQVTWLENLDLFNTKITDKGLAHLRSMRSLKKLDISYNPNDRLPDPKNPPITGAGLLCLKEVRTLESLRLPSFGVTDADMTCVADLDALKALSVSCYSNSPLTDAALKHLEHLHSLERLSIGGTGITAAGISSIAKLPRLRDLFLIVSRAGRQELGALATIRPLESLQLYADDWVDVSALNRLSGMPNLTNLKVSPVRRDGRALNLANLPRLATLSLSCAPGSRLEDQDFVCLAQLKSLRGLQIGSYEGDAITDAGVAHLAGLAGLEEIGIGGSALTDRALEYLADKHRIRWMTLSGHFTDQGLRHVEDLTALQTLTIRSSGNFSASALQRLRSKLPNVRNPVIDSGRVLGASSAGSARKPPRIGDVAIPFTADTLDGKKISLEDYRGKAVLLYFWGTWCAPCVASTPALKTFQAKMSRQYDDFALVSLSMDDSEAKLLDFVKQHDLAWPQVHIGLHSRVAYHYGVDGSAPHYILVGPDGKIVSVDEMNYSKIEAVVGKALQARR